MRGSLERLAPRVVLESRYRHGLAVAERGVVGVAHDGHFVGDGYPSVVAHVHESDRVIGVGAEDLLLNI